MTKKLLIVSLFVGTSSVTMAQMVGTEGLMHGYYVEVGINGDGGFEGVNTDTTVLPTGYHPRSNVPYFGFVANPQKDFWVNYDGDFYTPGTPENGWGIEIYDTTSTDTFNLKFGNTCSDYEVGIGPDIPGAITAWSHTGGVTQVNWHGDLLSAGYDLDFDIVHTLGDTDLYYTTQVTIFNNGPANIEHLYYYRNIDPDNNMITSGSFVTTNTIVSQGSSSSAAVVKAEQTSPWLSTFAFYANDSSARVSHGGFINRDGSEIWTGTGPTLGAIGSATADEAVSLAFHQANLLSFTRSGSSTATFTFQTVFDAATLNWLIGGGLSTGVAEDVFQNLAVYPNPANDVLHVNASDKINAVIIFDNLGHVVYNKPVNTNSFTIDLSDFTNGIYFMQLNGDNGTVTKKIVRN